MSTSDSNLPSRSRTVIIGAGAVGCSVAYHLSELGAEDVTVVDQGPLPVTGGSSVLLGTALAGGILGTINAVFSNLYGNFFGQIALLMTAIIIIRLLPGGLTGLANTVRDKLGEQQS